MQIVTAAGVHLEVRRLERRVLDAFAFQHPAPVPPEKEVILFGGFKDTIPDVDNAEYKQECIAYALLLFNDQLDIITDGVTVLDAFAKFPLYLELLALGLLEVDNARDFLQFVALRDDADVAAVIDGIMYLSTTTERGIQEARQAFGATWGGLALENVHVPRSPARFSRYYEDRTAAQFAHYAWDIFSALSGPEQSVIVAHYRTYTRLNYLSEEWAQRKTK